MQKNKRVILMKKMVSPEWDEITHRIAYVSRTGMKSKVLYVYIRKLKKILSALQPKRDLYDQIWEFWITTMRGDIAQYGRYEDWYEEGLVTSYNEFEEEWRSAYPDPVQWYKLRIIYSRNVTTQVIK